MTYKQHCQQDMAVKLEDLCSEGLCGSQQSNSPDALRDINNLSRSHEFLSRGHKVEKYLCPRRQRCPGAPLSPTETFCPT